VTHRNGGDSKPAEDELGDVRQILDLDGDRMVGWDNPEQPQNRQRPYDPTDPAINPAGDRDGRSKREQMSLLFVLFPRSRGNLVSTDHPVDASEGGDHVEVGTFRVWGPAVML
jgi:hypothetical protein